MMYCKNSKITITSKKNKGIILSTRSILKLEGKELEILITYLNTEPAAYKNIRNNTTLCYKTIKDAAANGFGQVNTVLQLRDFIKKL